MELLLALAGLAATPVAAYTGLRIGRKAGGQKALEEEWAKDEGWWTVIGLWHDPDDLYRAERFTYHAQAPSWQEAEDQALHYAQEVGGTLLIAAVFAGKYDQSDRAPFADRFIEKVDWTMGMGLKNPKL